MDFEIGHINIGINSEEDQKKAALAIQEHQIRQDDEGVAGCPAEDDTPIVDWHTDSYPFVCVLMLSDCSKMIRGETALRTGSGDIMKVRGPGMVFNLPPCLFLIVLANFFREMRSSFRVDTLSIKRSAPLEVQNVSRW